MTACTHWGRWRGTRNHKLGTIHVHQCDHPDVNQPTVETQEQRDRMVGSQGVVCEGCPFFERKLSDTEQKFTEIFAGKEWGNGESASGPGSSLDATAEVRRMLPVMCRTHQIESLLDVPCGDHHWMSQVDLPGVEYIGADVVLSIVEANRQRFPGKRFEHLDLIRDELPKADAVFVRDCLVHLPYADIRKAFANIVASGATWLIATHFPLRKNHDIKIGSWRPLDLTAAPFYLPTPIVVANEGCTEGNGAFADKSLGVWKVEDIRGAVSKLNKGPRLTIGMATYRDWAGVWSTVQALLMYHREIMRDVQLVLVDNDPNGHPELEGHNGGENDHSSKCRRLMEQVGGLYIHYTKVQGTAAAKGKIFEVATAPTVLIMDCHVMVPAGQIEEFLEFAESQPDSKDLWQGTCLGVGDKFDQRWGSMMYGRWANDPRSKGREPFEIVMQGCGLFACHKKAWPGFHPLLRGFGPEEFHLHQRIRRNGGKCYWVPFLDWSHRFGDPDGVKPPESTPAERLRGHLVTHLDTGERPLPEIRKHFVDDENVLTNKQFFEVLRDTVDEFWSDRQDMGRECPHRGPFLHVVDCEVGCQGLRKPLPIFACSKHDECAGWRFQQPQVTSCCGSCPDNPLNKKGPR